MELEDTQNKEDFFDIPCSVTFVTEADELRDELKKCKIELFVAKNMSRFWMIMFIVATVGYITKIILHG